MAHGKGGHSIQRGRPYPEEFDLVQYPKGFVAPSFELFDGVGNPHQHLAHFRAGSCNVGGSDALLFRQFVSSLFGVAFDWYAELLNGSVKTFIELEFLFVKRFAGAQHHIIVGDLVVERQKPNEGLVDYILRWRNLSLKYEPQLQEQHVIEILLRNIHGPIALILKGFTIWTFEKLLSKASSLQSEASQLSFLRDNSNGGKAKKFKQKIIERKDNVSVLSFQKEKQIQITEQQQPTKITEQQPKKDKERVVKKPDPRGLTEKINKQYSFRRDTTKKIFKSLIQDDNFQLPKPKRPIEVDKSNDPNYCPYHKMLGHVLEDCYVFKDWVQNEYKSGRMSIHNEYLANPSQGFAKVIHVEVIPTKGKKQSQPL
ncbi:uncharacterized protein LOC110093776 [Dendrobium catenatum]|uniref:uncharacterized protein LOC110093776 n=1 Tax=Dendrobium catenatum TaxID=906689 RepID=UPI0009F5302D|nr:uncharacterized protein LOC110093776 [Dendrobium catenatum]